MDWYTRLRTMKDYLNLDNKEISVIIGNTTDSVKTVTSPSHGGIPRWLKLAIVVFETMIVTIKKLEVTVDYHKGINNITTEKDG